MQYHRYFDVATKKMIQSVQTMSHITYITNYSIPWDIHRTLSSNDYMILYAIVMSL